MSTFVDQGFHCTWSTATGCCMDRLTCVQRSETLSPCCDFTNGARMSLACCPTQYACSTCSPVPSVQSGNIRHAHNVATTSSRGPTFDDGRIKPDLVAPGEDILSAHSPIANSLPQPNENYCGIPSATVPRTFWESQNMALRPLSGTSMAVPLIAGAIEKIRQYFRQGRYPSGTASDSIINPDSALLRAVILASAQPLGGSGGVWNSLPFKNGFSRFPIPLNSNIPDIFGGFGLPVLDNAVTMAGGTHRMLYTTETFRAASNVPSAFSIACDGRSTIPVTLVLVWTDAPGSTSSQKQLVNDLDLIVLCHSQLFGNMRPYADSNNVVERTVCTCPSSGSITAIVAQGETIRTATQTWYLVANGAVNSISKLSAVPSYNAGRITNPATTTSSCLGASMSSHTLRFLAGQQWIGSSWDINFRIQEFRTVLSTLVRVNYHAIMVSMPSPADGTVVFRLRCSSVLTSSTGDVAFITAATLRTAISTICAGSSSPCSRDTVLSAFDWNNIIDQRDCGNGITCAAGQTCMSNLWRAGRRVRPLSLPIFFICAFICLMCLICLVVCLLSTLERCTLPGRTLLLPLRIHMWSTWCSNKLQPQRRHFFSFT
jgi:hypothetical protein